MAFIQKEKIFSKEWFRSYVMIIIGAFIMASGFVFFINPNKLAPGGVYGVSIILHHLIGTPLGVMALLMDIPLTIIGIKVLGPRFGIKTVVGFVATAGFTDLLNHFQQNQPLVEGDVLLSAVFGGVVIGLGLGLIFKAKATSGGSDIIAMIIAKHTKMPLGQLMIWVDSVIVLAGLLAFKDWKIPLYSWIVIFITGKVIDVVLHGVNYDKVLMIVSDHHDEIREKIIKDLNRGGTFLKGEGMYKGREKKVIYTVVNRRELSMLQEFIHKTDPKAFMTVFEGNEVIGNGFKSLKDTVE